MRDIFITSSILILAILLIRVLVRGKINPCIQYALWFLVVIRLVLPVPLWNSRFSVMNFFPDVLSDEVAGHNQSETVDGISEYKSSNVIDGTGRYNSSDVVDGTGGHNGSDVVDGTGGYNSSDAVDAAGEYNSSDAVGVASVYNYSDTVDMGGAYNGTNITDGANIYNTSNMADRADIYGASDNTSEKGIYDLSGTAEDALKVIKKYTAFIWAAGILFIGGYMLFYQRKWKRYLYANRRVFEEMEKYRGCLSVYTVDGLPSPCLSGRSIYLTGDMAGNKEELEHILAHEYCHYRQLDSLWVIVRCILAAIYWFNPLVWVAAYVSKQDSELACDDAAIRLLGEDERIAYGKTLVKLVSGDSCDRYRIGIASTMSGGEKGIKERISMIAKKPKYLAAAAAIVFVVAAALIALTFSGAGDKGEGAALEVLTEMQDEDALGSNTLNASENNTEALELKSMKDQIAAEYDAIIKAAEAQNEAEQKQIAELEKELKAKKAAMAEALSELEQLKAKAGEEAIIDKLMQYDETIIAGVIQDGIADIKNPNDYMQSYVNRGESALDEGIYKLSELNGEDNSGIIIYGIYTKEYGCMGIKTLIGEDVNNYAIRWQPSVYLNMEGNISIYEKAEDGMPRVFAWKTPNVNSSDEKVWDLYLFDRYDTGTLAMYRFCTEDYYDQMQERLTFGIIQSEGKIYVYDNGELAGKMDIPTPATAAMKKIEEVVLDTGRVSWELGGSEDELKLITAAGLKYEGVDRLVYQDLDPIAISVECGYFGEHSFKIGKVSVGTDSVVNYNVIPGADALLCDDYDLTNHGNQSHHGNTLHHDDEFILCNPCPDYTRISDSFGVRTNPVTGEKWVHNGIDLAAEQGADIVAAADGTVHSTGYDMDNGNHVILCHDLSGEFTYYTACAEVLVSQGENVTQGQKIATVGSTGRSTGPHLHFALSRDGAYVEPEVKLD